MSNQTTLMGNENSFLLRPLRFLFEKGKKLPQMNTLWFQPAERIALPFAVIAQTSAGRLIFWPPLPQDVPMFSADGEKSALDHITLELSNQKSHSTYFK